MDAAAAACAGKGPPQEKWKRKRRKLFDFLLQFYFHDQQLIACCSWRYVSFDKASRCNCFFVTAGVFGCLDQLPQ